MIVIYMSILNKNKQLDNERKFTLLANTESTI